MNWPGFNLLLSEIESIVFSHKKSEEPIFYLPDLPEIQLARYSSCREFIKLRGIFGPDSACRR